MATWAGLTMTARLCSSSALALLSWVRSMCWMAWKRRRKNTEGCSKCSVRWETTLRWEQDEMITLWSQRWLNEDLLYKVKQAPTCTIVSRFCLDVDTVLVWADGLMVTTVTWWWGCWVSVGAGTMTVGWWVGAGGVGGASTWRTDKIWTQLKCVLFFFITSVFIYIQLLSPASFTGQWCICVCVSDLWTVCLSVSGVDLLQP